MAHSYSTISENKNELTASTGDITHISLFGKPWLILNSYSTAVELLDKRGALYSNRPVWQMAELTGLDSAMAFLQNNDRLREYRKFFMKVMGNTTVLKKYNLIEEEESQRFARRLLANPEGFLTHVEYFAAAVIMHSAMKGFGTLATPGRFLVEMIPPLRYVPEWFHGAGWKRFARKQADFVHRTVNEPYEWAKSQMGSKGVDSFVSDNWDEDLGEDAIDLLKWSASAMYAAGGDTTVGSIQSFFFAMAKYPEVQAKAQAEIDSVVGNDRLPSLDDWDNLPYIRALTLEVLRWHSIGPLGIPHVSTGDDVYGDYFIPKGTTIIANIWGMLHDPNVYRNPDEFDPSRFLKVNSSDVPELDPRLVCFGFGRRICPGRLMAEASIYISCATILASFSITKSPEADLKYEVGSTAISHIKPFKCNIKPRSSKAVELINRPLSNEHTD
ncbi:hypothetical protein AX16_002174 [Volvariella volvacea WC 439]|nr:hypothetical protein AX16_002174 [Volvariella volvacea WC 439]